MPAGSKKATNGQASEEQNCVACDRPDSFDDLVQCDECNSWWHMQCASVTPSISERPFSCNNCQKFQSAASGSHSTFASSRTARIELQLKQLEEQRDIEKRELEAEKRFLRAKYELLQSKLTEEDDDRRSDRSRLSRKTSMQQVKQWLANPANRAEGAEGEHSRDQAAASPMFQTVAAHHPTHTPVRFQQPERTWKQQQTSHVISNTVPTQLNLPTQLVVSPRSNDLEKDEPITLPPSRMGGAVSNRAASPSPVQQGKPLFNPIKANICQPHYDQSFQQMVTQFGNVGFQNPRHSPPVGLISQDPPMSENLVLSPSQLAARQVLPRDLQPFHGDPAEWPLFISSYTNSTIACGFNNVENLARLQRCLKGAAYESVKSRLLLPESVPQVLQTLQLLYGRPELLIHVLLDKVRSVPTPKPERLDTLIEFGLAVQSLCDHLVAAKQEAHLSNPSLLMELVEKLPAHVKLEWAGFMQQCQTVNLKIFGEFMSSVVVSASKVTLYTGAVKNTTFDKLKLKSSRGSLNAHNSEMVSDPDPERVCHVCKEPGHRVSGCEVFGSFSVDERWKAVQANGLCRSCLNAHGRRSCRGATVCGINNCEYRHHRMLHANKLSPAVTEPVVGENHTHLRIKQQLLFRIVPVTLYGPRETVETYAFLDDGSSLTLIEESLVEQLGVRGRNEPLCLRWTGNMSRVESNSQVVQLDIAGVGGKRFQADEVQTVKELALPRQSISFEKLADQFQHLRGIPVCSYENAVPRLLVGVNNLHLSIPLKTKEGKIGEPVAVKTRLGWCLFGGTGDSKSPQSLNVHLCDCQEMKTVHETVKNYFALEEVGITPIINGIESREEKRAKQILKTTIKRIGNKFEVGLLWKFDHAEYPDTYGMALRRLECLERRMSKDPQLHENLHRQISEYQAKGYAHRASEKELKEMDPRKVWFLPLGIVVNARKPGKIRIIWDAAATVDGVSLNSFILKGPDQLTELPAVFARFRQFSFAVVADLKEMFHQILLRSIDKPSHSFLWRSKSSDPPEVYMMDVIIFGSSCAPAIAQYVKNTNAETFADRYPRAVTSIIQNHYVDDFLDSFEDENEAVKVSEEVKMIHEQGGFELRNWLSNSEAVLRKMGEAQVHGEKLLIVDKNDQFERVLGMLWSTRSDVICFPVTMKDEIQLMLDSGEKPTKRKMLKCMMAFFDPLGLLSVFSIHGKVLLQDAWRVGLQWDDEVCDKLEEEWRMWTDLFPFVRKLTIPRCYFPNATMRTYQNLELHIFVDASEKAYSAVAYFRVIGAEGVPVCALVAAKAKVAPLKPLSIPRMELQAAVLGTRLKRFVVDSHTINIKRSVLWSDSTTVLAWIRADHRRYKQYVAYRIGELLTSSNTEDWRWVPSGMNPADAATKWGTGPHLKLKSDSEWFVGPDFLRKPESEWPQQPGVVPVTSEELRPCYIHHGFVIPKPVLEFDRFSKWKRMIRALGYVHRFIDNLKRKCKKQILQNGHLTQSELQRGESSLIRMVQWTAYPDEMVVLLQNQLHPERKPESIQKDSKIYRLSPFLDECGVLRIDGRISAAPSVQTDVKFPVIMPRKHRATQFLVESYHAAFRHGNTETVVNEIRQRYYISQLRTVARSVARFCQWCKIQKTKPQIPRMAPLPLARLSSFTRPFTYVGLDFFGPFLVKVGRSNVKRWIALFTCLTVRAVHVEVAYDLSTESCIKCVRRFISRRGAPCEIYSDNGTNFQGAERLLRDQMERVNGDLAACFTSAATKWLFIPPGTPHMGGAWERMVRAVKSAMASAYTDPKLDDEGLQTMVVEAEWIVNSRPLTYLPLDSEESEALTPNHFLLGSSTGSRNPGRNPAEFGGALKGSWNEIQRKLELFWTRWLKEYLPTLTRREKWFEEVKPIKEGDLVFVLDGSTRGRWERGRILEVIRSGDGRIRQALVQTARGLLRRSVSKLAVLDVAEGGKTGPIDKCYGGDDVGNWQHGAVRPIDT
ncbi:uncharacterized protein LOC134215820 [Armigeres subalbatus]|uniref:uncharacterized protein LOC134215820 n=1 Tax=Armigeres subalbatus TaxID=124917 RepID=UPI002ECFB74C